MACKGHYSSQISQAVGNMLHQGWTKLFLQLKPGPNPAEQLSRAWGCPWASNRDWNGVFLPPIVGAEPSGAQSTCHPLPMGW